MPSSSFALYSAASVPAGDQAGYVMRGESIRRRSSGDHQWAGQGTSFRHKNSLTQSQATSGYATSSQAAITARRSSDMRDGRRRSSTDSLTASPSTLTRRPSTSAATERRGPAAQTLQRPSTSAGFVKRTQPAAKLGRDGRPISYVCYLCGAQFGSQSLFIHVGRCQEKWLKKEADKPRREQRRLPPPPPELEAGEVPSSLDAIDDFNARMFEYYNKISLCQCPHCGRSFNEEAYARHSRMCTAETPGGPHAKGKPSTGFGSGPSRLGPSTAASRGPAQKPRAYTCYLCGQQYGSQSLSIHIPRCQEKFLKVESMKPKGERRKLPPCPEEALEALPMSPQGIDEFNAKMFEYYNGVSLYKCPHCARSFNADAFERHKRMCTAETPGGPHAKRAPGASTGFGSGPSRLGPPKPNPAASDGPGYGAMPRAYMCYLCGQQFGSQSLPIHVPQCEAKWQSANASKPAHEQRAPPPRPQELEEPLPTDAMDIDAFNSRMSDVFNGATLCSCEHCGRTFNESAFRNHRKICTAERPFKPAPKVPRPESTATSGARGDGAASLRGAPEQQEDLIQCEHCNRRFNANAFMRHQNLCTADKPMKALKTSNRTSAAARPAGTAAASASASTAAPPSGGASGESCDDGRLTKCINCKRSFTAQALARHAKICSADQPLQGTSGAAMTRLPTVPESPSAEGDLDAHNAAAPPTTSSGLTRCPHCRRSFTQEAYERHSRVCAAAPGERLSGSRPGTADISSLRADFEDLSNAASKVLDSETGQCGVCGRTFATRALARHEQVCAQQFASSPASAPPAAAAPSKRGVQASASRAREDDDMAQYGAGDDAGIDAYDEGDAREQCPSCGRSFNPDVLARHARVCKGNKKRKPMDMTKQRLGGLEGAPSRRPGEMRTGASRQAAASTSAGKSAAWKQQSEDLRSAMKASREVTRRLKNGESLADMPYVPSAPDPSLVPCPHCGRRFNEKAATRHIPHCANTVAKPKFLKAGTGGAGKGAPTMLRHVPSRR